MPKAVVETRLNTKLTDFFSSQSQSQLKARRVGDIIDLSSPSDKKTVISVSSDDNKPFSSSSSSKKRPNLKSKSTLSRTTNSKKSAGSSRRSPSRQSINSQSTLSPSRESPEPINLRCSSRSKAKRTLGAISADSSDNDASLPAIVLPPNNNFTSLTPKALSSSHLSPLTPRQNLEFPAKNDTIPRKSSKGSPKNSTPIPDAEKRPSPHKRPRHHSPEKKAITISESDADDENELCDPPRSTPPRSDSVDEPGSSADMDIDDSGLMALTPSVPLISFQSATTTPTSKRSEIIPSSQHGETELGLPMSPSPLGVTNEGAKVPYLHRPVSRLSLSGLTSDDDSDLTDLSDSSTDLELDLSDKDIGKGKRKVSQSRTEPQSDSAVPSVRRSSRHHDVPAPNYKLKLSLFRSSPPPIRPSKAAGAAPRCPLDKIVKESVHLKAAAELESSLASSRTTDYAPETPQRSRLLSEVQFDDSPILDQRMKKAILGEKESDAVDKILQTDRSIRKKQISSGQIENFSIWDDDTMLIEDAVTILPVEGDVSPLVLSLRGALSRSDYDTAALLIDSGALVRLCYSPQLLVWLFQLVFTTQSAQLSTSAYRAILSIQLEQLLVGWLDEQLVHWVMQRLGLKAGVLQLLNIGSSFGRLKDLTSKISTISSLLSILSTAPGSQALTEAAIPCMTAALMTLGMDSLIESSLRGAVVVAIEAILSGQSFSKEIELLTIKTVHRTIMELAFTLNDQTRLLELFSGCSSASGCVRRWIAWSMLGGDLQAITAQNYGDFPPFVDILNIFTKDATDRHKMIIHNDVDYQVLGAQTDILSAVMTDIEGYAMQAGGKEFVDETSNNLGNVLAKIYDTRAAHLDRSRTKDAMNRLRDRLQYQLTAAKQVLQPRKDKLHHFFEKKPRSVGVAVAAS